MLSAKRGCRGREEAGAINCDFAFAEDGKRLLNKGMCWEGPAEKTEAPKQSGAAWGALKTMQGGVQWHWLGAFTECFTEPGLPGPWQEQLDTEDADYWNTQLAVAEKSKESWDSIRLSQAVNRKGAIMGHLKCHPSTHWVNLTTFTGKRKANKHTTTTKQGHYSLDSFIDQ